jgi:hypothetical protein
LPIFMADGRESNFAGLGGGRDSRHAQHQGIARRLPADERDAHLATVTGIGTRQIRRKPVLGGLISDYVRAAWRPEDGRSPAGTYFRTGQDRESGARCGQSGRSG